MNINAKPSDLTEAATGGDWKQSLLLTKRQAALDLEPFPVFCVENYLPPEIFEAARREFPTTTERDQYGNLKQVFSPHRRAAEVQAFLAKNKAWRELVEFFESDEFIQDLRRFLAPALRHARGISGLRRWRRPGRQFVMPLVDMPVGYGYEFSLLGQGAHLAPHTDSPAKLVSLLLYFPSDDWKPEFGGTTDFYRPKNPQHAQNWMNRDLRFKDVELFYRSEFRPNRLCGFVKSANSFHGVAPLECGPDRVRLSFNFNVLIDPVEANSRPVRLINKWRKRREAPAFADVAHAPHDH
jgi:hypothetical protein